MAKIIMVKLYNLYWYSERHDIGCRLTITRFGRVPPRPERTHRSGFGNGPASAQAAHVRSAQGGGSGKRSEEHTSELQSLMRISYAVFCLKKKNTNNSKQLKSRSSTRPTQTYECMSTTVSTTS